MVIFGFSVWSGRRNRKRRTPFQSRAYACKGCYTLDSGVVGKFEYETFNAARAVVTIHGTSVHPGQAKDVMVNALAEAAKLFARNGRWSARTYEWVRRLLYLSDNPRRHRWVELEYIIRDHSMETLEERKAQFKQSSMHKNTTYDVPHRMCHLH